MKNPTILIADNKDEYRATVVEFLKRRNYSVIEASNPTQAMSILDSGEVDLALLDNRLINDDDLHDDSGLKLAIESTPRIPKVIITAYPRPDLVREALRRIGRPLPAAVDFLDKGEGLDSLLDVIVKILPLRDVFVVHGHDNEARLEVKEFLNQLHLNPIILKDLPNSGQFIMEKLERASGSIYAIVLLMPDDHCLLKNDNNKLELRARQNVILEMGYFMGKLGRDRVCALYGDGVALPSDIHGFLWIKMDSEGAWKIKVARELRAAGIYVDLNEIL